ncbi:G2 and S phase-expressed protein 1 isoform X2 [Betta splendens]|uniref:G2 and S phase-expressed protein 1 isoform X2 n=1 Tax=Betta splendens TaxID=158456 RepID=A0A6P7MRS0_BETSP|nr:G2 and S phase-expressed protein 1 isoform X2 [Betta splendens]
MEGRANNGVFFLIDEEFDFDVSLSPASSTGGEDEDEVFVGPVTHKETCVSVHVSSQIQDGGGVRVSWSPLTGDQLDAVCQEAHRLATELQSGETNTSHTKNEETTDTIMDKEEFIQDAADKLGMLTQAARALSPIKRETFCVQDSPMKQLPPAIQRHLQRGSKTNTSSSLATATSTVLASRANVRAAASSTRLTARLNTSSPVTVNKVQPKMSLRGKASLGVGAVLPSKPAVLTSLCSTSKNKVEKARLQLPSKSVGSLRGSPVRHASSRAESYEDLLSDSTSVASDISDSSLNSSLVGKRTLAPPTKGTVRKPLGVKAPALQSRRVTDRKNTSSSSSSVSSFNSSISLSPAKGKINSSLNRSLNGSTCITRAANPSRPRRSTVNVTTESVSSTISRRSFSTQAKKLPEVERAKAARSTPLKRADAVPVQATPPRRVLERTTTIPPTASVRMQSAIKVKPQPLVIPTPTGGVKGVRSGDDALKMMKPKRLMSAGCLSSLPQKPAAALLTPSASESRLLQVKARRPSGLPTPVRHKTSAIPTPTSHKLSPRLLPASDPAPSSAGKKNSCSPVRAETREVETGAPEIKPFSLEEEEELTTLPAAPSHCSPEPECLGSTDSDTLTQNQTEPARNLIELESTEESNSNTQEVLLLDLPAPALHLQEKLLIDLTNTPDLIRTSGKTCTTSQLIDLSSPLIKWSPEDKKENNAPLINLSF